MRMKLSAGLVLLFVAGIALEFVHRATAEDADAATPADHAAQVERGKYLVTFGDCSTCHTPKNMAPDGPRPDITRLMAGHPEGTKLPELPAGIIGPDGWAAAGSMDFTAWIGPWGISFAANLTPDVETGIGAWTSDMFAKAMRTGQHKGENGARAILPPMPWYAIAALSDEDLHAMFAYLMSLPPVKNKVPDPVPPAAPGK